MTIEELMRNEQFQEKLYGAKDVTDVRALFASEGVDLTADQLLAMLQPNGENRTEEELENASGGGSVMNWLLSKLGGGK